MKVRKLDKSSEGQGCAIQTPLNSAQRVFFGGNSPTKINRHFFVLRTHSYPLLQIPQKPSIFRLRHFSTT